MVFLSNPGLAAGGGRLRRVGRPDAVVVRWIRAVWAARAIAEAVSRQGEPAQADLADLGLDRVFARWNEQ